MTYKIPDVKKYIIRLQMARFFPPRVAARAAAGWGGDRAQVWEHRKSGRLAVIWQSIWDTERDARQFFSLARQLLVKSVALSGVDKPYRVHKTARGVRIRTRQGLYAASRKGTAVLYVERLTDAAYRRLRSPAPRPRPRRPPPPRARPPRKKGNAR